MKFYSGKLLIKYILILSGLAVMLGLILISVALIICDDDDYRRLAVWSVERAVGYRMIVDGPFAVGISTQPSLTVEGIRFEPIEGGPYPHLKSVGRFHLKIGLMRLLLGSLVVKRLQIVDVTIADVDFQPEQRHRSQPSITLPDIDLPIFESISLGNIKITDSSRKMRFHLNRFTMDDVENAGPVVLEGNGVINDREFRIDGHLGALTEIFNRSQPYPVNMNFEFADVILTASGTIADYEDGAGLNLQFASTVPHLQSLLKLMKVDFKLPGELEFNAMLAGDIEAPRLNNLRLSVVDEPSLAVTAEGAVRDLRNGEGTDISLSVHCHNPDLLGRLFPEDWETVEKFNFEGALRKIGEGFRIEDVAARIVNNKGIHLETTGWLHLDNLADEISLKSVNLNLRLTSPQTEPIRPLLTNAIPEIGSVDARARLTGPIERLALEDLHVVRGGTGPVRVETHGRIGWIPLGPDGRTSDMDFTVTILAQQSSILSTFYGVPIDEIGTTTITGQVTGATDRFQLKNIVFHSKDERGLETHMSGGIDFVEQDDGDLLGSVNFDLKISAPNMGAAQPLLGANLVPTLGPVSARGKVVGSTNVVSIEDIDVSAGNADNLQIKWQGRVGKFPLGDNRPIAEVQTFGSLQAVRSSDFTALFGVELPDIGPIFASWREIDRNGTYGVSDLKFTAGDGKHFNLNATGGIASVIQGNKAKLSGVDLRLSLKATDTDKIFKLLNMQFPNLGTVDGGISLTGDEQKLMATDLRLKVSSARGLVIDGTGGVGYIGVARDLPVRDIDIYLTARVPGLQALPIANDWGLPDFGALEANVRVGGQKSAMTLEIIDFRAGPRNSPMMQMRATLDNIGSNRPVALTGDFRADSRPWIENLVRRNAADSPRFDGSIRMTEGLKQLQIDRFKMSTSERGGLDIVANGTIDTESDHDLELNLISKAADPAKWGELLGISLPQLSPLTIDGHYSSLKQAYIFEGGMHIGKTRFQTLVRQPTGQPRIGLEARITSPCVYLEDLGISPGKPEEKTPSKPADASKTPLFSDDPLPMEGLRSNNISLNFQAERVEGQDAAVGPVNLDINLKDGRLHLATTNVSYRQGQLSLESVLDTTGPEPRMSLKLTAEDMDIDSTLTYLRKPVPMEGKLNLTANLNSRGLSTKQLAANLSGEFGVAIENGRIQRGVEMIASDALDLLFTAPAKDMYTDLNCMAGRMVFEDGDGNIQILYLDTPGIRARGGGAVNLGTEEVDIFINPESKRRFFRPGSPIRIKGPLRDPSVTKIPAAEAAMLASQLAIPIVALPARALGMLWSLINEDKDENSPCLTGPLINGRSDQKNNR